MNDVFKSIYHSFYAPAIFPKQELFPSRFLSFMTLRRTCNLKQSSLTMTKLVGILNITPDSFSDGGAFFTQDAALTQAERLIEAGASIIDIGAESTRPGATPLTHEQEWERLSPLLPSLKRLLANTPTLLSVDTRHAETAARALGIGADWINDTSGGEDPKMQKVLAKASVPVVIMHHLGLPADPKRTLPADIPVTEHLMAWAKTRLDTLEQAGIARSRVILDPGIGFGKTAAQSFELIRAAARMRITLECPLLIGHSRKSFLSLCSSLPANERDLETHALSFYLAQGGIDYLRVHDVEGSQRMLRVLSALRNTSPS